MSLRKTAVSRGFDEFARTARQYHHVRAYWKDTWVVQDCGHTPIYFHRAPYHHVVDRTPIPSVKCFRNVFLDNCDKNFVFHWFTPKMFGAFITAYIGSHPCDPRTLVRFPLEATRSHIFLHENFRGYKARWFADVERIQVISAEHYDGLLKNALERAGKSPPETDYLL